MAFSRPDRTRRARSPRTYFAALAGTPRRIAATTTLALTFASFGLSGLAPASVAAEDSATSDVIATAAAGTPAATLCPVDSNNVPTAAAKASEVFTIAADGDSTASYTAHEVLSGQGSKDPVGTTAGVIGTILLGDDSTPITCSTFYVDLRTLTTDDDRRDNQVQKVLETSEYPLGTFVVTSVEGLDGSLTDGKEHTAKLIGDLTVHNVTKTVSWDAKITLDGDKLTGTATTSITFQDFGMEPPVFGPVASMQDDLQLAMNLVATKSN